MSGFENKKIENKSTGYDKVVFNSRNTEVYSNSVLHMDDVEGVNLDSNVVSDDFIGPLTPGQRHESDEPLHLNVPSNDWIFGDKALETGQYGGNQGSLFSDDNRAKYLNDPKINEIINKYYSNVSDEDKELLFDRMNRCGCGYVAIVNSIMLEYIFHGEDEFMEKFGYKPYELEYDENGELYKKFNYDYLFLDYFLYYAKNEGYETIDEVYGNIREERENSISQDGALGEVEFDRTGMDSTSIDDVAEVTKSFLASKGIKMEYEYNPKKKLKNGTLEWEQKRDELASKGIEIDDDEELYSNKDIEMFQQILDSGGQIVVSASHFTMYSDTDVDGNYKYDDVVRDDVGGHAMYVVGTTSDPNKIVVSSWGCRRIIDIREIDSAIVYRYHR